MSDFSQGDFNTGTCMSDYSAKPNVGHIKSLKQAAIQCGFNMVVTPGTV